MNGYVPSSENRHITHGIERARARQEIMEGMEEIVGVLYNQGCRLQISGVRRGTSVPVCITASLLHLTTPTLLNLVLRNTCLSLSTPSCFTDTNHV